MQFGGRVLGQIATLGVLILGGLVDGPVRAGQTAEHPAVVGTWVPVGMDARSTAVVLTGAEGWTDALAIRARRLAELHTFVIGVDTAQLLKQARGSCADAAAMIAPMARDLQADVGAYRRAPVLVGIASGGALALSAAQASPDQFKGLLTDGFGPDPSACAPAFADMGGKAPIRWFDIERDGAPSPVAALRGTKVRQPAAKPDRTFYRSYLGLAGTDSSFDTATGADDPALASLPLTIHHDPAAPETDVFAIFLSGDGGWAAFDEEISNRLAAAGVPVVGISSLRYLWRERRPPQIAADIDRLTAHFAETLARENVLLIGFSLGANVTPFYLPLVSRQTRLRTRALALIAPEERTGFEIVVGGWLGRETGAEDVAAELGALLRAGPGFPVACLYGMQESRSPCIGVPPGLRVRAFSGGHHLGKDYDAIAAVLLDLAGPAPPRPLAAQGVEGGSGRMQ